MCCSQDVQHVREIKMHDKGNRDPGACMEGFQAPGPDAGAWKGMVQAPGPDADSQNVFCFDDF